MWSRAAGAASKLESALRWGAVSPGDVGIGDRRGAVSGVVVGSRLQSQREASGGLRLYEGKRPRQNRGIGILGWALSRAAGDGDSDPSYRGRDPGVYGNFPIPSASVSRPPSTLAL